MKTTLNKVMRDLAALDEPTMREANERRGDDHGVNLTHLRTLAKQLKTQYELALQLWTTSPIWFADVGRLEV
jgi:3-methyladenine DNA glycosylase AlkD